MKRILLAIFAASALAAHANNSSAAGKCLAWSIVSREDRLTNDVLAVADSRQGAMVVGRNEIERAGRLKAQLGAEVVQSLALGWMKACHEIGLDPSNYHPKK